jgi:membrane-bound metal-dependent hydrolase YbcI (DUF457 family)
VFSLNLDYPLHGFFHSFIGGTLVGLALSFVMFKLRRLTFTVMKFFRLEYEVSWKRVLAASLLGVYLHILLDAPLYMDIRPFYSFNVNPLFSGDMAATIYVYMFYIFSFFAGVLVYALRLAVQAMKKSKTRTKMRNV